MSRASVTTTPRQALHGYPRSARLRRSDEFRRVSREGRKWVTRRLVVLWAPAVVPQDHARFGLTVSRKVGNAVVRNRVKRRLRDAIRQRKDLVRELDVVFIARTSAASASSQELASDVQRALERMR